MWDVHDDNNIVIPVWKDFQSTIPVHTLHNLRYSSLLPLHTFHNISITFRANKQCINIKIKIWLTLGAVECGCVKVLTQFSHSRNCTILLSASSNYWLYVLSVTPDLIQCHMRQDSSEIVFGLSFRNNKYKVFTSYFFLCSTAPFGPGYAHCRGFTITLRHLTCGRTPLEEWWARSRDLYLTTYNVLNRYLSPAEFEPAFPANEQRQRYGLDRSVTVIGTVEVQK
jgi:hypothetical protein